MENGERSTLNVQRVNVQQREVDRIGVAGSKSLAVQSRALFIPEG
jgi:hypothetical protein